VIALYGVSEQGVSFGDRVSGVRTGFPVSWRMCFDLLVQLQIDLIIVGSFVVLLKLLDYDWYNTVR